MSSKAAAAVAALKKKGFDAVYVATREEAVQTVMDLIPEGASVGFGGSITTRDLALVENSSKRGYKVLDHWQAGLSPKEIKEIRRKQLVCDVFLTSANAVTIQGEIINVDGVGNRVSASIYGPGKIIMIVGNNKLVNSLEEGMDRSRQVAGVMNAKRLKKQTPCVQTGECSDCNSKDRICNVTVILHRRPSESEYIVIVVGEDLGF